LPHVSGQLKKKDMPTTLTEIEWIEILQNQELTNKLDIDIFQTLYSFDGHQTAASQVGLILGNKGKNTASPLNLEIGRYAKRITNLYDIDFTLRSNQKYKFWDLFFPRCHKYKINILSG